MTSVPWTAGYMTIRGDIQYGEYMGTYCSCRCDDLSSILVSRSWHKPTGDCSVCCSSHSPLARWPYKISSTTTVRRPLQCELRARGLILFCMNNTNHTTSPPIRVVWRATSGRTRKGASTTYQACGTTKLVQGLTFKVHSSKLLPPPPPFAFHRRRRNKWAI